MARIRGKEKGIDTTDDRKGDAIYRRRERRRREEVMEEVRKLGKSTNEKGRAASGTRKVM